MTRETKVTKTISLYLNFNNEKEYRFAVDIGRKVTWSRAKKLIGVNSFGK